MRILGVISGIQGVFYVVNAVLIVVGVARFGISGPGEVANASGVTFEVIIFLFFGIGMIFVAVGWFTAKRWARAPFLLAQLMALVVSVPLMSATDPVQKWAAILVTLAAVIGVFLAFTPAVTRHLLRDEAAPESQ